MEEIKDVIMRAKTIKDNEKEKVVSEDRKNCGVCRGKFRGNYFCIQCIRCSFWIHLKCTQYKTRKEAKKHKPTFLCKPCLVLEDFYKSKDPETVEPETVESEESETVEPETVEIVDDDENSDNNETINREKENTPKKSMTPSPSTSQRIATLKSNINALTRASWLLDSHIDLAVEDIQKYEKSNGENTLYFVPSISHLIKVSPQDEIEAQLSQNDAIYKRHIAFIVNDCKGNLGSGEGSHWSLLVFSRNANTWYHMDSGKRANTLHAKQIADKVNKYLVSQGNLENLNSKYIESRCTQQKNGYDCGPLAILFAQKTANMISRGEPLHTCYVNEDETYSVREWIHNELNNRLLYLEKGEVHSSGSKNSRDKDKDYMEKSKKICWFHKYRTCKFGSNCPYWHPIACKNIHDYGECRDNKCKLLHQNTCTAYREQGRCPRENCWFIHPHHPPRIRQKERRDRSTHENNKRRFDRQNGNNRFSGSNISQSRVQSNTNTNHFKKVPYYREGEFFRRDWPTPTEEIREVIQRTIREVIQKESGGWGRARW